MSESSRSAPQVPETGEPARASGRPADAPAWAVQDAEGPEHALLTDADLPEGWHLARRFPGERSDDASALLDDVLGYDDSTTSAAQADEPDGSEAGSGAEPVNETSGGRWRYIEHEATGTRVFIRLQRQMFAVPEEVRVTGVVYLPWRPGEAITSKLLRELPVADVERAVNARLFAMKRETTIRGGRITLPSGVKVAERDLLKPLSGTGKSDPDFYQRVALQHGKLVAQGDRNPSATIARINEVALTTAQGWVAKARARGLLPPGRRGRAG